MWELSWCCGRIARDSVQLRSEPHPQCDSTCDTLSQHTRQGAIHIAFSFSFGLQTADFHSPFDLLWRFDLQEMFVCLHSSWIWHWVFFTSGCYLYGCHSWLLDGLLVVIWQQRGMWLRQLQVKLVFGKCWCKWICTFPLCKRGPHLITYSSFVSRKDSS